MILLLDLDDTLISNAMETFQKAYLKGLGKHLSDYAKPDQMIRQLLYATQRMITNTQLNQTLEEVFDHHFYPALGLTKSALRPAIEQFYAEVYPALEPLITPRPSAIRLVETALKLGIRLVVATNPLFPRTAILQRMAWGQLSHQDYPFELITSYESLHFAKPNPAYYSEIYAQLGWPNEPVMMVGNDLDNDIKPAARAGFATYWVTDSGFMDSSGSMRMSMSGSLDDLVAWISHNPLEKISLDLNAPEALKYNLTATPAALLSMVKSSPLDGWDVRPAPDEWSLTEVICHLRDVENEVNNPRLDKFSHEDNPFFPGVVTDPWSEERKYIQQNGTRALKDFALYRQRSLDILNSLPPPDWDRTTRHSIFGPTPFKELISFIATHDRSHLQQSYQLTHN